MTHHTIYNLKDKFECIGTVLDTQCWRTWKEWLNSKDFKSVLIMMLNNLNIYSLTAVNKYFIWTCSCETYEKYLG